MRKRILKITKAFFGMTFLTAPSIVMAATNNFKTMFGGTCSDYLCWIEKVWNWSLIAIVPLSILVIAIAGFVYMISGGNPDRVSLAKKLIAGALSGLGLLILSGLLLKVLGVGALP